MANAPAKRYRGEEHFIDGYVPQSMNAEYSSLHRSATWIGMGMVLASLAMWGTFIFGLATTVYNDQAQSAHTRGFFEFGTNNLVAGGEFNSQLFLWGGLIGGLILLVGGFVMVGIGRRQYKAYKKEFGGHH